MAASKPSFEARELSFPVPKNPHATVHVHLSSFGGCSMIHLTTTTIGESAGTVAPMGSFVYAMPDVRDLQQPVQASVMVVRCSSLLT